MAGGGVTDAYYKAYTDEKAVAYPMVDAFEHRMGFSIDRDRLDAAACILACPLKAHPPNWQHGRVLYAAVRRYWRTAHDITEPVRMLDIGTAKGFSALVLTWAAIDAGVDARVTSLDVVDPDARVHRNSIAEQGGLKTVREFLAAWPEADGIEFLQQSGAVWLSNYSGRIHVAFVDGKHTYEAVKREADLLTMAQRPGDLILFDDVQVPGVWAAVEELKAYQVEYLEVLPHREYAIARRK